MHFTANPSHLPPQTQQSCQRLPHQIHTSLSPTAIISSVVLAGLAPLRRATAALREAIHQHLCKDGAEARENICGRVHHGLIALADERNVSELGVPQRFRQARHNGSVVGGDRRGP